MLLSGFQTPVKALNMLHALYEATFQVTPAALEQNCLALDRQCLCTAYNDIMCRLRCMRQHNQIVACKCWAGSLSADRTQSSASALQAGVFGVDVTMFSPFETRRIWGDVSKSVPNTILAHSSSAMCMKP